MRSKRLRSLGFALVILGAAVLVAPSLGFQTLDADRSVSVHTVEGPNAKLGLEDDYDNSQIEYSLQWWGGETVQNQIVANVTNRVENPLDVTVEVATVQGNGASNSVLEVTNPENFVDPMGSGASRAVELGCSQDVGGQAGDATVELAVSGDGDPVSVTGADVEIEGVSFDCAGAAGGDPPTDPIPITDDRIDLEVSTQPSAEYRQFLWYANYSAVTWGLENTGDGPVAVSGIQIGDSTEGIEVSGPTELEIAASTDGNLETDTRLDIGGSAPTYDLDQDAEILQNQEATVTLGQFRTATSWADQVDMRGESVTVVLMVDGLDVPGRERPVPVEMELAVAE